MGSKLLALGLAGISVVALVDVLKNPPGATAAANGAIGLIQASGNTLLGQTQTVK